MSDAMTTSTITISGAGGDDIEAYLARPATPGPRGGVVVIHHLPGYDRATKEIVRRFAELGYDAICPNLYSREAPGAEPSDAAATVRARAAYRTSGSSVMSPARPRTCAGSPSRTARSG